MRGAAAQRLRGGTGGGAGANAVGVVGDFQADAGEPALALMKERFVSAFESVHGHEPEKTWPTPVNTFDPSPHGCLDYVFVAGGEVQDASLAFDRPHALDAELFPSDHIGVTALIGVS